MQMDQEEALYLDGFTLGKMKAGQSGFGKGKRINGQGTNHPSSSPFVFYCCLHALVGLAFQISSPSGPSLPIGPCSGQSFLPNSHP